MFERKKIYILHGWSVDSENKKKWQHFISTLRDSGCEVTFLGIPGLSSPLEEVWNLDDFVKWLEKELPRNEKVIVLGHSFGGQIAIKFSALFPERIKKLILIDSAGIRDHAVIPTIKRKIFLIAAKVGKLLFPIPIFKTLLYTLARERDYHNASPLLKRTMSNILDEEVVHHLPQISTETLIIWGENDKVTPLKLATIFKEKIKHSTLIVIEAARHSPQFTHTKLVSKHVIDFIKGK